MLMPALLARPVQAQTHGLHLSSAGVSSIAEWHEWQEIPISDSQAQGLLVFGKVLAISIANASELQLGVYGRNSQGKLDCLHFCHWI